MSPLSLPKDSDVLTLQAVVHREMPSLFESPAHDRPLEECVDGVHLGGRKLWVSGVPVAFQVAGTHDPQPPAWLLAYGFFPGVMGGTQGRARGRNKDSTWLKRCSRQPWSLSCLSDGIRMSQGSSSPGRRKKPSPSTIPAPCHTFPTFFPRKQCGYRAHSGSGVSQPQSLAV